MRIIEKTVKLKIDWNILTINNHFIRRWSSEKWHTHEKTKNVLKLIEGLIIILSLLMSFNTQKYGAMTKEHRRKKGVRMRKEKMLKELRKLQQEFKAKGKTKAYHNICDLLEMDYMPKEMDIYEVNISSQSTSIIDGWRSHIEESKYYSFYVEFVKKLDNKMDYYVNIDLQDVDLLVELYAILKGDE